MNNANDERNPLDPTRDPAQVEQVIEWNEDYSRLWDWVTTGKAS